MDYGQQTATAREKQPELTEAHFQLQELGSRLNKCLDRLTIIGNKLSDESNSLSTKEPMVEPSPRLPGLVSDIHNDIGGFKAIISKIESQLLKLENQI